MPNSDPRGLVLVRLGHGHRISPWLTVRPERRRWDLALSLYDEVDLGEAPCVDYLHRYSGGKWDGIFAFFQAHPEALSRYDYFWLVDDDIEATPDAIDALFAYARRNRFELAQPALSPDSYYSHRLTVQCPGFSHRCTNFVEIMAPLLSCPVLTKALPLFKDTWSGLGIDWYWHRLADHPEKGVAIIDAIAVGHRRPLKTHLRHRMRALGRSAIAERRKLARALGLYWLYPVAFSGVLSNGQTVESSTKMAGLMMSSYWSSRKAIVRPPWRSWQYPLFYLMQVVFTALRRR